MPTLSPLTLYNDLFMNFVPTANFVDTGDGFAAAAPAADAMLTNLASRRSVLDFATTEIEHAPHDGARRRADEARQSLRRHQADGEQPDRPPSTGGYPTPTGNGRQPVAAWAAWAAAWAARVAAAAPRVRRRGRPGRHDGVGRSGRPRRHDRIGRHRRLDGQRRHGRLGGPWAARRSLVAPPNVMGAQDPNERRREHLRHDRQHRAPTTTRPTSQWSARRTSPCSRPRSSATSFAAARCCGRPARTTSASRASSRARRARSTSTTRRATSIQTNTTESASSVAGLRTTSAQFLFAVQQWFFTQQADEPQGLEELVRRFGNSLLDYTVVPYVTEVRATQHERDNMPGMIIGGKLLGFAHNIYNVTRQLHINQFWGLIAQAVGYTSTGGAVRARPSARASGPSPRRTGARTVSSFPRSAGSTLVIGDARAGDVCPARRRASCCARRRLRRRAGRRRTAAMDTSTSMRPATEPTGGGTTAGIVVDTPSGMTATGDAGRPLRHPRGGRRGGARGHRRTTAPTRTAPRASSSRPERTYPVREDAAPPGRRRRSASPTAPPAARRSRRRPAFAVDPSDPSSACLVSVADGRARGLAPRRDAHAGSRRDAVGRLRREGRPQPCAAPRHRLPGGRRRRDLPARAPAAITSGTARRRPR